MAAQVGILITFELDGGERQYLGPNRCVLGEGLPVLIDKEAAWVPEPVWDVKKKRRIFATS
jgi:hypothetical protein